MIMEDEIHGFVSGGEYERFVKHVHEKVADGALEEVDVDGTYTRGEISGGRWFRDGGTGEIWRLVAPDFPFRGLWERVVR